MNSSLTRHRRNPMLVQARLASIIAAKARKAMLAGQYDLGSHLFSRAAQLTPGPTLTRTYQRQADDAATLSARCSLSRTRRLFA